MSLRPRRGGRTQQPSTIEGRATPHHPHSSTSTSLRDGTTTTGGATADSSNLSEEFSYALVTRGSPHSTTARTNTTLCHGHVDLSQHPELADPLDTPTGGGGFRRLLVTVNPYFWRWTLRLLLTDPSSLRVLSSPRAPLRIRRTCHWMPLWLNWIRWTNFLCSVGNICGNAMLIY